MNPQGHSMPKARQALAQEREGFCASRAWAGLAHRAQKVFVNNSLCQICVICGPETVIALA